jgi:hypothetical protein
VLERFLTTSWAGSSVWLQKLTTTEQGHPRVPASDVSVTYQRLTLISGWSHQLWIDDVRYFALLFVTVFRTFQLRD